MQDDRKLRNMKIVFIMLLLAIGLVSWFDYKRSHTVTTVAFDEVSHTIGKWEGVDILASDEERKRAADGDLIIRQYKAGEDSIYLVAIQERGDRHRVHSPVNCYTGSGWTILKEETVHLGNDDRKTIRRMLVNRGPGTRLVYYWFTNGREMSPDFMEHLFIYFKDMLFGRSASTWAYFDVSTDVGSDPDDADSIIMSFLHELDELLII
jgi:EpsI family protein